MYNSIEAYLPSLSASLIEGNIKQFVSRNWKNFPTIALLSITFFLHPREDAPGIYTFIRYPVDCAGLDSVPVSCGRAYLESVLVDTALVLLHGRVIRALSLLRLSSLAPCQRARRLLSARRAHRAMLPWHFPLRRTGAPKLTKNDRLQPSAKISDLAKMWGAFRRNRSCYGKTPPDLERLPAISGR